MVSSEFRNNAIRFAERRSMRDIKYLGWCGVVCRHNHSPTSAMPLPPPQIQSCGTSAVTRSTPRFTAGRLDLLVPTRDVRHTAEVDAMKRQRNLNRAPHQHP
jgi:hypothetical protein